MTSAVPHAPARSISAFPAVFLAGSLSLFLGAALSDAAYASSYEIQWNNFASWLLVGALVFAAVALIFALRDALSRTRRTRARVVYAVVLGLAWLAGFLNSLVHARDAWASMPTALVYSCIALILAIIATWMAFRGTVAGDRS